MVNPIAAVFRAHALIASSGMATIGQLARVGADDAMLSFVARSLADVHGSLSVLASHEAQVVIGPAVNFATDARLAVTQLGRIVEGGSMPSLDALVGATAKVDRIASRVAVLR